MTSLIGCCTELLLGRNEHCTTAALIVLGLVTYLGVICCTSKQVPSPSSHPLTPNPCGLIFQSINVWGKMNLPFFRLTFIDMNEGLRPDNILNKSCRQCQWSRVQVQHVRPAPRCHWPGHGQQGAAAYQPWYPFPWTTHHLCLSRSEHNLNFIEEW